VKGAEKISANPYFNQNTDTKSVHLSERGWKSISKYLFSSKHWY